MTIYIDEFFLVNFTVDYLLLAASAALSSSPIRRGRFALAALLGSGYGILSLLPELRFLSGAAARMAFASAITLAAFGFGSVQRFIRRSGVFFISSFIFAGFLGSVFKTQYPVPPAAVLISSALLAYGLLTAFLRNAPTASACPAPKMQVEVQTDYGHASLYALADTGSSLRDPFTGDDVLILSLSECRGLLPEKTAAILKEKGCLAAMESGFGFRLIPYKSIGGDGFLPAMRPLSLMINGKRRKHTLIAFTCSELSESTGCSGIMGI